MSHAPEAPSKSQTALLGTAMPAESPGPIKQTQERKIVMNGIVRLLPGPLTPSESMNSIETSAQSVSSMQTESMNSTETSARSANSMQTQSMNSIETFAQSVNSTQTEYMNSNDTSARSVNSMQTESMNSSL